jgi:hypothetical protein
VQWTPRGRVSLSGVRASTAKRVKQRALIKGLFGMVYSRIASSMAMQSMHFIGEDFLDGCQSGQWVMSANDHDLAVMRVQEALTVLGYNPGTLDGVFGTNTGNAVSAYKRDQGLSPTEPVMGPGRSNALDNAMYFDGFWAFGLSR